MKNDAVELRLSRWLAGHLDAYLDDLATLVNRDCGTLDKSGVNAVIDWMADRGQQLGAVAERRSHPRYGDVLLLKWGRGAAAPSTPFGSRILISGHADTVYPPGTAASRPLRRDDSLLIGPGVADMKAGLLSGLFAIQGLQAIGEASWSDLGLIVGSEEEKGSPFSREWLTELAPMYDAGLVLEAARANGNVVTGRKGGGFWTIRVTGKAAHAGVEPEAGASAFIQLAHLALALDGLNGQIPGATLVIGTASAGEATNMVPPNAQMTVDGRAEDIAGLDQLAAAVESTVEAAEGGVPGTTIALGGGVTRATMPRTNETLALFEMARESAASLGFDLGEQTTGGTSDANFLAAAGLPVLDGLGPIGGATHTADEWLDAESIVPRTAMLGGLIARISQYGVARDTARMEGAE